MNKTAERTVALDKGRVDIYTENGITLYAYQTRDAMDDEVFVLAKAGRGVVIELPCFYDNIRELTDFLAAEALPWRASWWPITGRERLSCRRRLLTAPRALWLTTPQAAVRVWWPISGKPSARVLTPDFAP